MQLYFVESRQLKKYDVIDFEIMKKLYVLQ